MKISQNKEQVFIKGLDEVESDILAIVKRFFERNPEEIWGSIDGIILEVLRRVKLDLIEGNLLAGVSSVNGKTGAVELVPEDIGAEPAFEKNTAFNKNFGSKSGTVCEGNDPRLSDKREPVEHEHDNYITELSVDNCIEAFLRKKGITFESDNIIKIYRRNLVLESGTITEE